MNNPQQQQNAARQPHNVVEGRGPVGGGGLTYYFQTTGPIASLVFNNPGTYAINMQVESFCPNGGSGNGGRAAPAPAMAQFRPIGTSSFLGGDANVEGLSTPLEPKQAHFAPKPNAGVFFNPSPAQN